MIRRQRTTTWLLLLSATACSSAWGQYLPATDPNASFTTIWNVPTGNWTTAGNWIVGVGAAQGNPGGVPDFNNQDFGLINNGGTATVNSDVVPIAGGVILG